MTESQRAPEGLSTKPRIKPADAGDTRPVSVSARLGRLQFHNSGKFRVLQISDIQDGPKIAKDTIALIEASLDTVRPDLVIFTGNQIAGYDPAFAETFRKRRWSGARADADGSGESNGSGGGNGPDEATLDRTRDLVRRAAAQFLEPLVSRGVPFAVTYGNHDFQCGLDNAELDAIYREFPGCLNAPPSPDHLMPEQTVHTCAPGTLALPVASADRAGNVLGVVLVDSGDYVHGGGFASPSDEALAFLREVPAKIGAPSLVFQHMPLPQYYDVLSPVASTAAFAMQGYRAHDYAYFVLDGEKTQPGGYLGEGVSCPDEDCGEFDMLRGDHGGFIGVSAAHDHRNGFVGELDGLLLIATPTCGFNTYGPAPAKRATRLIEFDIRHPYQPRTQLLEFGEIVGKPSSKKAYTYALNQKAPQDGEGDDLLRKPSLWRRVTAWLARR
ncbi:serine/threonine protein phosphatase [Bifidobacterium lemurum]|uniref:Serine/threonine protein phosphatase n=1 Tax=Bifidobacterium lemurum TaxID=1603886 RepID=A0A261FS60_9BIFI|nr:metallophosphoesterase [Bifidobacterium lemurum]OZG62024.1 serine/threonine protein phosphatase [Bifidobacterium lemurum]QOL34856.1 metallophosphoesterase [Bifidobacterium lemurum]